MYAWGWNMLAADGNLTRTDVFRACPQALQAITVYSTDVASDVCVAVQRQD